MGCRCLILSNGFERLIDTSLLYLLRAEEEAKMCCFVVNERDWILGTLGIVTSQAVNKCVFWRVE